MSADDQRIAKQCGMTFKEAAAAIQSAYGQDDGEIFSYTAHISHRIREPEAETSYTRPKAPGDEW